MQLSLSPPPFPVAVAIITIRKHCRFMLEEEETGERKTTFKHFPV